MYDILRNNNVATREKYMELVDAKILIEKLKEKLEKSEIMQDQ